nr:hypothetical protein CFP56_34323 [Quercus suber]
MLGEKKNFSRGYTRLCLEDRDLAGITRRLLPLFHLEETHPLVTRTEFRLAVETASASWLSYIASSVGPSLVTCLEDKRVPEDDDLEDEIMFDIEADLEVDDMAGSAPHIPKCSTY